MLTRYKDRLQNVRLTIIPSINPISVEYSDVIVIYHQVIFHVGATNCSRVLLS